MISLYLDPLPGPLPAKNGLQGRKSEPKFRCAVFDQHIQFCSSRMILPGFEGDSGAPHEHALSEP